MDKEQKVNIVIRGNEKNKNEIVYNNVVDSMDKMKLSKDEQVEYLKCKVASLESETKAKLTLTLTIVIGFLLLCLGLFFMYINYDILGIIVVITTFVAVIVKLLNLFKVNKDTNKNDNYDKIEQLRMMLNIHIK